MAVNHQKQKHLSRGQKLLILLGAILLVFVLIWAVCGLPSLSAKQAYSRAARSSFLSEMTPDLLIDEGGLYTAQKQWCALSEREGTVYAARLWQGKGLSAWFSRPDLAVRSSLFWEADTPVWEYSPITGVYLVNLPLINFQSAPVNTVVKAPGETAELTLVIDGENYPAELVENRDGWFLFRFPYDEANQDPDDRYTIWRQGAMTSYGKAVRTYITSSPQTVCYPLADVGESIYLQFHSYGADGQPAAEAIKTLK